MKAADLWPSPPRIHIGHVRWGSCLLIVLALHVAAAAALEVWRTVNRRDTPPPAMMIDLGLTPDGSGIAGGSSPQIIKHASHPAPLLAVEKAPRQTVKRHRVRIAKIKRSLKLAEKTVREVKSAPAKLVASAETIVASARPAGVVATTGLASSSHGPAGSGVSTGCCGASGLDGFGSGGKSTWLGLLLAHLERYKRYPLEAEEEHQEGVVYLQFTMDRSGRVLTSRVLRSSGYEDLDQATLALIQRAQPLPPPPSGFSQAKIDLVVPVQYQLPDDDD